MKRSTLVSLSASAIVAIGVSILILACSSRVRERTGASHFPDFWSADGTSSASPAPARRATSKLIEGTIASETEALSDRGKDAPPGVQANLPLAPGDVANPVGPCKIMGVTPSPVDPRPQWLPAPGEELWIIACDQGQARPQDDPQQPRGGAMLARRGEKPEERDVPMPLKHTDVKAVIDGYIATVDVTQQFHNPFDSKIEAVYVFPLPSNAAVWARTKIADLSDFVPADRAGELAKETKGVALEYGLMSAYTAFVAVDSSVVTAGTQGTTVQVAVPVPEGVKYETTVPERR